MEIFKRQRNIQNRTRSGPGSEPPGEMVVEKCPWISLLGLQGQEAVGYTDLQCRENFMQRFYILLGRFPKQ